MACATCERMRLAMKRWVARKTGQEWTDEAVRPPVDAPVPHGRQDVAGDTEGAAGQGAAMSDVPGSEPSHRGQ